MNTPITILGAGIAGLTTAIALQNNGIDTIIFESSPHINAVGAGLGLAHNAIKALQKLGLEKEILAAGKPIHSFAILDQKGKTLTKSNFDKHNQSSVAIHRAALQEILVSKLNNNTIHLGKSISAIVSNNSGIEISFNDQSTFKTDYLIAAEGIHSVSRKTLVPASQPRYAGYTCWRAVIDYPESANWESSETWGKNGRFGIIPLANGKLYWFACVNASQKDERFKKYTVNDLENIFGKYHHPIPQIIAKTTQENLLHNDIIDLKPIDQFAFENIVLIGDAAHATTPNMAQGACQAIEDAVILANCMKKEGNYKKAFKDFEQQRLARTRWITKASWNIGKIAQLENQMGIFVRNKFIQLVPESVQDKQQQKLMNIEF